MKTYTSLKNYRPNVGICLFNKKGQVWVGKRAGVVSEDIEEPDRHLWQMPQGGIDKGERVETAAWRELYEETGVSSARLMMITPGWIAYTFPKGYNVGRNSKRWRGQRQKWAIMLFEGKKKEIDLECHGEVEFSAWRWVELEDLANDMVVPFKQGIYEELVTSLLPMRDFIRAQKEAKP